jgi:hypothetical protein
MSNKKSSFLNVPEIPKLVSSLRPEQTEILKKSVDGISNMRPSPPTKIPKDNAKSNK